MSFWNLSDNNQASQTDGNFNAGGGDMEPIPANTQVKAAIDEVKWDEYQGESYISARWSVLAPEEFKNRKVFQKIKVNESDNKKADKAKRMLAAIAANAGGGLLKIQSQPTDQDLKQHLSMKPMALTLMVWEMERDDGTTATGNWVQQVAPLNAPLKQQPVQQSSVDPDVGF